MWLGPGPARSQAFFFELLLLRDVIIHCPDSREGQLPKLRAAIDTLPGDSSALAQLLGGGRGEEFTAQLANA